VTAIVTGAGGDIGGACALELARTHENVLCVDRDGERAAGTVERIAAAGGQARVLLADAADPDFGTVIADAVDQAGAVVHALAYEEQNPAESMSVASFQRSLLLGPVAAFTMFRALFLAERLPAGSSLVVIGSLHATTPFANCIGYNAAHGALAQVVRSLAHEWAQHRIRVNAAVPGWIRTQGETDLYGDAFLDKVAASLPYGRFGTPDDVAAAVGFLCSDRAAYVSGSFLTVDGALAASLARLPDGTAP
jgi:NAD(P)-dependent dehydrogenase (short-subunit alcohol dehydrogenase family)